MPEGKSRPQAGQQDAVTADGTEEPQAPTETEPTPSEAAGTVAGTVDEATPQTVAEYREAQRAEWGVYVATQPIYIDGVRAFNAGDPVPVSHLENGVVSSDDVEKKG